MKRALASGLLLAWIAWLGSGCATKVRVEVDPGQDLSHYRTWDWVRPSWQSVTPAPGVDRVLEALLREAIERELGERGFARATSARPDFLVAYHLTLERELVRGLETPAMQTLVNPHREGGFEVTASRPTLQLYEKGTLVLVVADAGDQRCVWRGIAIRRVRESFKTRAEEVVSDVLARFPSATGSWL